MCSSFEIKLTFSKVFLVVANSEDPDEMQH